MDEQIALGGELYGENCARCHGANLEGEPDWWARRPDGSYPAPPHDRTGHTWHHSDAELRDIVRDGGQGRLAPGDTAFELPARAWAVRGRAR